VGRIDPQSIRPIQYSVGWIVDAAALNWIPAMNAGMTSGLGLYPARPSIVGIHRRRPGDASQNRGAL